MALAAVVKENSLEQLGVSLGLRKMRAVEGCKKRARAGCMNKSRQQLERGEMIACRLTPYTDNEKAR
jgi:hypothetical protein